MGPMHVGPIRQAGNDHRNRANLRRRRHVCHDAMTSPTKSRREARPLCHHLQVRQAARGRRPWKAQKIQAHDARRHVIEGVIETVSVHTATCYKKLMRERKEGRMH